MPLSPGARVGVYEIVALLGVGGMGEVYRARDSRLQRDVAIKVLPDRFAGDPDRLARFQREAQLLASLAHAHIGQIYGLEDGPAEAGADSRALVLELVEGPTLADLIARGPLGHSEALAIAGQVADAVDAAHQVGIIHRDLKPANIKVRDDGTVKVLDFGLAKLAEEGSSAHQSPTQLPSFSPTLSAAFTEAGIILGTAAYMAPEQARGKRVDKRVDVWAFGCVLFEMLTGKRAFDGTDATEMIAAVVRGEPEWAALPPDTPLKLRVLLKRCLEKDPARRVRDMGDVRFELDHALDEPLAVSVAVAAAPRWRQIIAAAAAIIVVAALAGVAAWTLRTSPPPSLVRFTIGLPEDHRFSFVLRHIVAIAPDGSRIAYVANNQLFLREMDQLEPAAVRGTSGPGAAGGRSPFFSPDGQWIGFWQDGQLKKVSITGGAPVTLSAAANPWGASWGTDDTILFGQGPAGISRVSGAGGAAEVIVKVDPGQSAHGPQMLPGGREVLFTLGRENAAGWDDAQIVAQNLETGARTVLVSGGSDGRYLPTGHLVYVTGRTLLAVPFDVSSLRVTGGPVPFVEQVAVAPAQTGTAHFSISENGILVYVAGDTDLLRSLVWVDREGREEPVAAPPRPYAYARLSPDGSKIALDIRDEMNDIWIWDVVRKTLTRLTFDAAVNRSPVWSPDGRRIAFSVADDGTGADTTENLYWQPADGSSARERLTKGTAGQSVFPTSFSRDGRTLVFDQVAAPRNPGVLTMETGESRMLFQSPSDEANGEISPDGRWIAYDSDESGRDEIYVRPFPDVNAGRWQVSTDGGTRPAWSRDGKELFYYVGGAPATLMAVDVKPASTFTAGIPHALFTGPYASPNNGRMYDVSPDGRRFLMIKASLSSEEAGAASITVVQNWFEELKRRVPPP